MTDIQWFAFVILPVAVAGLGWIAAWLGRRHSATATISGTGTLTASGTIIRAGSRANQ